MFYVQSPKRNVERLKARFVFDFPIWGKLSCSRGYKNKKLRSECSEFLFVVAPTGIEPVFHA